MFTKAADARVRRFGLVRQHLPSGEPVASTGVATLMAQWFSPMLAHWRGVLMSVGAMAR